MIKKTLVGTVGALVLLGAVAAPASAKSESFSNPAPINMRAVPAGNADLYPSPISVSGFAGTTSSVTVRINNLTHAAPDEVGILLRAPNGDSLQLQSGAGDSTDVNNTTYTFSDGAFPDLPTAGAIAPGTYQPTSYYGATDDYPSPGPGTIYGVPGPSGSGSFASSFGGENPNGTWNLFVRDFVGSDGGVIAGGWKLKITDSLPFAPDNDVFAAAQVVSGATSSTPGNNSLADRQSGEPDHCVVAEPSCSWIGDHSVWYSWTALGSGPTSIDTCVSKIDSILAVYTGDSVGALNRITDNNNSPDCPAGTFGSKVTFNAIAGTNYKIAVGDAGGDREDGFTLQVAGQPAPVTADPPPAVDLTAPDTTITRGPRARTHRRQVQIAFTSSEPGSTFECARNGGRFTACSSPRSVRGRRGRNTFEVRSIDPAGNVDLTPARYRWRVTRR